MGRYVQSVPEEDYKLRICFHHHDTSSLARAYLGGKRYIEYSWDDAYRCRMSFMSLALLTHNLPLATFLLEHGASLNDPSDIILSPHGIRLQVGFLECLAWSSDSHCIQRFQHHPSDGLSLSRTAKLCRFIARYFESEAHTMAPFIQNHNLIQALRFFKLNPSFYELILDTLEASPQCIDISSHSLGLVALSLVRDNYWQLLARALMEPHIDLNANWSIYPEETQDEVFTLGLRTALILAIEKNKLLQVSQLLALGADVNFALQTDSSVEASTQTFHPRIKSVLHDWTPLLASVASSNIYMVHQCLRAGAYVHHRSFDGTTAFSLAKQLENPEILNHLRAPLQGVNALNEATRNADFDQAITLLQGGADPRHVDIHGDNAFDVNPNFLNLPAMRVEQARSHSPYYFESFYAILIIAISDQEHYIVTESCHHATQLYPFAPTLANFSPAHSANQSYRDFVQHFEIPPPGESARALGRLTYSDSRQYGISFFEVQTVHLEVRALRQGLRQLRSTLKLVPIGPNEAMSAQLSAFIIREGALDSTSLSCKAILKYLSLKMLVQDLDDFETMVARPHQNELKYHYDTLLALENNNLTSAQWLQLSPSHNPRLSLLVIAGETLLSLNFMQCACRLARWDLLHFILREQPNLIDSLHAPEIEVLIINNQLMLYKLHLMHRVPSQLVLDHHLKLAHESEAHSISRFLMETFDSFHIEDLFFEALRQGRVATFDAIYPRLLPYSHSQAILELPHLGAKLHQAVFERLFADYPEICTDVLLKRSSAPCIAPWTWLRLKILKSEWPMQRFIESIVQDERELCLAMSLSHPGIETAPMFRLDASYKLDLNHGLAYALVLKRYALLALLVARRASLFHCVDIEAFEALLAERITEQWWSDLADTLQACTAQQYTRVCAFLIHLAPSKSVILEQFFLKLNQTFMQYLGEMQQQALTLDLMRLYSPYVLARLAPMRNSGALIENLLDAYLRNAQQELDNRTVILNLIDHLSEQNHSLSHVTVNLIHEFISSQADATRRHLYELAFAALVNVSSHALHEAPEGSINEPPPQHSPLFSFSPLAKGINSVRPELRIVIPNSEHASITLTDDDFSLCNSPMIRLR